MYVYMSIRICVLNWGKNGKDIHRTAKMGVGCRKLASCFIFLHISWRSRIVVDFHLCFWHHVNKFLKTHAFLEPCFISLCVLSLLLLGIAFCHTWPPVATSAGPSTGIRRGGLRCRGSSDIRAGMTPRTQH